MARRGNNRRNSRPRPGVARRWWALLARGLNLLLVLALVGSAGWGSWQLLRKLDAPIAVISVESRFQRVGRSEIEQIVAKSIDGGFLSLSLDEIRASLEAHPWIESASARRKWPDRVEIAVVEEIPIARWGRNGFLNRRGEALDVEHTEGLQALPLLQGPKGTARQVMKQYRDISQLLQPVRLQISEFSTDRRGSLQLRLDGGPRLLVGRDNVMQRMRRFLGVWQLALRDKADQVAQIDIRYGNGVAVEWKSDSKTEIPVNRNT